MPQRTLFRGAFSPRRHRFQEEVRGAPTIGCLDDTFFVFLGIDAAFVATAFCVAATGANGFGDLATAFGVAATGANAFGDNATGYGNVAVVAGSVGAAFSPGRRRFPEEVRGAPTVGRLDVTFFVFLGIDVAFVATALGVAATGPNGVGDLAVAATSANASVDSATGSGNVAVVAGPAAADLRVATIECCMLAR